MTIGVPMNSTRQWKSTFICILSSMAMVSFMATCSFAFGQSNQLRVDLHSATNELSSTEELTQDEQAPLATPLGGTVFKNQDRKTFQSSLRLPTVNQLTSEQTGEPAKPNRLDLSSVVSQVAKATVFVVVFCVGSLFLLRKLKADRFFSGSKKGPTQGDARIHLVGTIRLAGNRCLELIEADGQRLVVLCGAGGESSLLLIGNEDPDRPTIETNLTQEPTFSLPEHPDSGQARFAKLGI